ncbi:MAG TPA: hypothetical protein VLR49_10835 [Ferruginibacter sp.]|nr:hypothetical protein [Ferruginibacter sp.]
MSNQNIHTDSLSSSEFDKPTLPTGLNVLTILTFIGCGIQLLGTAYTFMSAQKTFDEKDKMMAQMNSGEMPGWAKSMMPNMENYEEMVTKSFENKLPILIIGLVAVALCVYGAIQMRKLQKQGFLFYVIGQLLPFISTALFLGMYMFSGVGFAVGAGITVLFILLYAINRKHLIY